MRALDDHVSLGDLVINPFTRIKAAFTTNTAALTLLVGGTMAVLAANKRASFKN